MIEISLVENEVNVLLELLLVGGKAEKTGEQGMVSSVTLMGKIRSQIADSKAAATKKESKSKTK